MSRLITKYIEFPFHTIYTFRLPAARVFSSMRHRNYRLLWLGNLATQAGFWMQGIAVGWLMLELTDSPFYLGLVGFARGIPLLILSPLGGVLADRLDRQRLMVISQASAMAIVATLAVLIARDWIQAWHMLLAAFLLGVVATLNIPARQALVPRLVGRDDLLNAVALHSVGLNAMRIFGPSLAGLLIAAIGIAGTFFLQAAAYLWSMALILQIRVTGTAESGTNGNAWQSLREGIGYVRGNRTVLALLSLSAVPSLFAMAYVPLLPVVARDILGLGPAGLGLLSAAIGLGALIGSLAVAGSFFRRQGLAMLMGAGLLAVMIMALAFSHWFWLTMLIMVSLGLTNSVFFAINNTLLQLAAPDGLRGRVMSVYMLTWGLTPLAGLWGGTIADHFGAPVAIGIGGAITAVFVLLIAWARPELRGLNGGGFSGRPGM